MNYIKQNKEAWEDAFNHKKDGWGEDVISNLGKDSSYYIQTSIQQVLDTIDLTNKQVAQFCCNNGRELLSIVKHYSTKGMGFDIAENMIKQANTDANIMNLPCSFISKNILEINTSYHSSFDVILFTIGAITWFEDLDVLFQVVSRCLKPGGILILHDFHPVMNMLPLPGEDSYENGKATLLSHKYFTKEPWIENDGAGYMTRERQSKTFTSFSHSISEILNAMIKNQMNLLSFDEYDVDVGLTDVYDHRGFPLSFQVVGKKSS